MHGSHPNTDINSKSQNSLSFYMLLVINSVEFLVLQYFWEGIQITPVSMGIPGPVSVGIPGPV